jgi:hypothetical protein
MVLTRAENDGDAIKRFTLLVLLQGQRDSASELVISSSSEFTARIKYKVHDTWYEMSPPPAHIIPAVLSELASLAGLRDNGFPGEGEIAVAFSGTHLRWKIRLSNTGANCFPVYPDTLGLQPWS